MRTIQIVGTCLLAPIVLAGCSRSEPIEQADIKAMMDDQVQPVAETYWQAVQYISDENGAHEIVPENEKEWNQTAAAARELMALGERMKGPAYAQGKGTDWMDFAQGLVDSAHQAEIAAKSHKPENVLEAGGVLYNVCSACHEVYMPSPGGLAPTDQLGAGPDGSN